MRLTAHGPTHDGGVSRLSAVDHQHSQLFSICISHLGIVALSHGVSGVQVLAAAAGHPRRLWLRRAAVVAGRCHGSRAACGRRFVTALLALATSSMSHARSTLTLPRRTLVDSTPRAAHLVAARLCQGRRSLPLLVHVCGGWPAGTALGLQRWGCARVRCTPLSWLRAVCCACGCCCGVA